MPYYRQCAVPCDFERPELISGVDMRITEKSSDAELLKIISEHRCQDAFSLFYKRHVNSAMALATHLCMNNSLAEEAVQETMIKVWRDASSFRSDGNARAWLMCMLTSWVHKHHLKQKRRSSLKVKENLAFLTQARTSTEQPLERSEQCALLHRGLNELPQVNREALILYFLGELSQDEISRQLSIPQRTVSKRIQESVQSLKRLMLRAGFSAVGINEAINSMLLDGITVPFDLETEINRSIASVESKQPGIGIKTPAVTLGLLGAFVIASATAFYFQNDHLQRQETLSALPQSQKLVLPKTWEFKEDPPEVFKVITGKWHWLSKRNGYPDAMVFSKNAIHPGATVIIRQPMPAGPLLVEVGSQGGLFLGDSMLRLVHATKDKALPCQEWIKPKRFNPGRRIFKFYFFENWCLGVINNHVVSIYRYANRNNGTHLAIQGRNSILDRIDIKSISMSEVPEALRDPERLLKDMKENPRINLDKPPKSTENKHNTGTTGHSDFKSESYNQFPPGLSKAWKVIGGHFTFSENAKTMNVLAGRGVHLSRTNLFPSKPFLLEIHATSPNRKQDLKFGASYGLGTILKKVKTKKFPKGFFEGQLVLQCYFINSFIFTFVNDEFFMGADFQIPYPNKDIEVIFSNLNIESLSLRELTDGDIPVKIRESRAFYEAMKKKYGGSK